MRLFFRIFIAATFALSLGCQNRSPSGDLSTRPIKVVATTGMIADAVRNVGGERVAVTDLIGQADPHTYEPSAGDINRLEEADIVFFNGLHLEGQMGEVFERMAGKGVAV